MKFVKENFLILSLITLITLVSLISLIIIVSIEPTLDKIEQNTRETTTEIRLELIRLHSEYRTLEIEIFTTDDYEKIRLLEQEKGGILQKIIELASNLEEKDIPNNILEVINENK